MSSPVVPRLQLLAAALLFSTGGAAIKWTALTGWQVASFRSGVAALTIALLVPASRRGWSLPVLAVSGCYATTMICFVVANKLTTAANTIFLQSTAPLYIMAASPWLLHERVRARDLLLMVVVAAGLVPFFLTGDDAASATAPDPARGNLVALTSGVAWAATMIGLRWLAAGGGARDAADGAPEGKGDAAFATVLVGNLLAFLVCLPLALPAAGGAADWAVIGYLGIFQIGAAYLFLTSAVRHVGALEASIILLAEPALNPIWAWLVHGERPSGWALAGGGVILGATIAKAWLDTPSEPASTPA